MKYKKQSTLAILQRLAAVEKELGDIRQQIVENMNQAERQSDGGDCGLSYSLDDFYNSFGSSKKHYATRLRHALQQKGIGTLQEFLALSPGQLLDLDNVSVGTLKQVKRVLDRMGIRW